MKFLADRMLGKLVKGLRMLGYDTIYYRGGDPHQLIRSARQEGRIILTRNTKFIPKSSEDRIVQIREDHPSFQLRELIQKGHVSLDEGNLFSRCLLCNSLLDWNPAEGGRRKGSRLRLFSSERILSMPSVPKNLLARISPEKYAKKD